MIFVGEIFLVFLFFGISVSLGFLFDHVILLMSAEDDSEMLNYANDWSIDFSVYWLN